MRCYQFTKQPDTSEPVPALCQVPHASPANYQRWLGRVDRPAT